MRRDFRKGGVQDRAIASYLSNTEFMTEFMHNYLDSLSQEEWTQFFSDYLNKTYD